MGVNMEHIRCQINCKCGKAAFHISKFHCSKARVSILFTLDANLMYVHMVKCDGTCLTFVYGVNMYII